MSLYFELIGAHFIFSKDPNALKNTRNRLFKLVTRCKC